MDASNKTPQEMLFHWEQTAPERVYLRQPVNREWHEFTWGDVGNRARRVTAALRELGLQPGDRVGIFSKNCAEWVIADFAIMLGGFVSYLRQKQDPTEKRRFSKATECNTIIHCMFKNRK